jgi:aryl-alcohol dehydrogenase-like predicted oxidoreductase
MTGAARLALGTVQFGLDYGATQAAGKVPEDEVRGILALAHEAGIDTLDTAARYGDAESVLGRAGVGRGFRIVTKTAAGGAAAADRGFRESLDRLQVGMVDAVLVHAVGDLASDAGTVLWSTMRGWKRDGLARRIGVSVYDRADIDAVMDRFAPDVIQLPLSALDQRLLADGSLQRLARAGVAVHLRSVFLQGLMLQEPSAAPPRMARTLPHLARWWSACRAAGATPLAAALGFALGLPEVERVIVGVHGVAHLREILDAVDEPRVELDWPQLAAADAEAIDPRRWLG